MKIKFWVFLAILALLWLLSGIAYLFMQKRIEKIEVLTEQEQYNKYFTEERTKNEIEYITMWGHIDSMTDEEFCNTFYKNDLTEFEYVQQNFATGQCS